MNFASAAQLPPCVGYAAGILDDFSNVSVDLTPWAAWVSGTFAEARGFPSGDSWPLK